MKKTDMEKEILLSLSGELSPTRRRKLDAWMARSPEARAYREEVEQLVAAFRQGLADSEPAPATVARLIGRARDVRRGILISFPQPVLRLVAGAAALAMVVASWVVLTSPDPVGDPVGDLHTIVAMISDQDSSLGIGAEMADRERMQALARHLLIMEGFVEETTQGEAEPLLEAPEPTTLQWRNTPGSLQEKYG